MSIIIKPIEGLITKDKDTFGKMDPYVVCILGQQKQTGSVSNSSGTKPQWSDTFIFNTKDQILRVEVWDKDTFSKDDLIGQGTVNLNQLFMYPNKKQVQYVDLIYKGKTTGRVQLSMEYQGPPMGGGNQQQGNWGNQQQGWNGGQQQGNWGNQQQGWNNGPQQQNWGNQQQGWNGGQQQGWNNGPQQGNWGNQPQNNQQGWGNNQQQGWGNGQQQGWNNGPQQNFGNQQGPPPGWGNNGWGPNGPPGGNNNGW